jgi:hypothetical protein
MAKIHPVMDIYKTETDFRKRFADNHACILWLCTEANPNGIVCSKCHKTTTHHYYKDYQSLQCDVCGTHYQPIIGTIYQKKGIAIVKWFLAIYFYSKNQQLNNLEMSKKIIV